METSKRINSDIARKLAVLNPEMKDFLRSHLDKAPDQRLPIEKLDQTPFQAIPEDLRNMLKEIDPQIIEGLDASATIEDVVARLGMDKQPWIEFVAKVVRNSLR